MLKTAGFDFSSAISPPPRLRARFFPNFEFPFSIFQFFDLLPNACATRINVPVVKIRQQLQVLRDLGLLTFLGSGSYRLS